MRTRRLLVGLILLLLGFGLRLGLYDYHGLEGDDAFSLSLTKLEAGEMLRGLATLELDIHPPLHFLLLKSWITLAGDRLLALRSLNILLDLITGALIVRLAGRLFSRQAAVTAGLLWLAAPLLIYSDYLVRMYTLLTLFTAGGVVCATEAFLSSRPGWWYVLVAVCGLLAAYTHILGLLIALMLCAGCVLIWFIHPRRKSSTLSFIGGSFALAGILYWPYFSAVWAVYRSGRPLGADISEAAFSNPIQAFLSITGVLFTHRLTTGASAGFILITLLLLGTIRLWQRWHKPSILSIFFAFTGIAAMSVLAWGAGFYKARYLTPFVPAVLVLAAGIITTLNRCWRSIAFVSIFALSGGAVLNDLSRTYRDDWLAATQFVQQHERPGDKIIVIPDWGQHAFSYHYQGSAPVVGLFPEVSDRVDYAGILEEQTENTRRVWFVHYQPDVSDPERLANQWFHSHAALITEVFPSGMHVRYYDFEPVVKTLPEDAHPLDAEFGNLMRLHGLYLPVTRGSAQDTRLHPPSTWIQVVLYWEALTSNLNVTPRIRLTDPYTQVYGAALEREQDVLHRHPVSGWQPGDLWQIAYDLNVNPQTPPGTYNIEVMVLDNGGQPLTATGADAGEFWVIAGQFVVQ